MLLQHPSKEQAPPLGARSSLVRLRLAGHVSRRIKRSLVRSSRRLVLQALRAKDLLQRCGGRVAENTNSDNCRRRGGVVDRSEAKLRWNPHGASGCKTLASGSPAAQAVQGCIPGRTEAFCVNQIVSRPTFHSRLHGSAVRACRGCASHKCSLWHCQTPSTR